MQSCRALRFGCRLSTMRFSPITLLVYCNLYFFFVKLRIMTARVRIELPGDFNVDTAVKIQIRLWIIWC